VERTVAPYGSWSSPITAELVVQAAVGLGEVWLDGERTWWSELRPAEGGRIALVRDGVDVLPAPWSARTRVHEYGGGGWWVAEGTLFFASWADQRLYRLDAEAGEPVPITPEPPQPAAWRYADGRLRPGGDVIACVREVHPEGEGEPANQIVLLPAGGGGDAVVLVEDHDFVSSPRWSPDGRWLAWVAWDHPNMPWDATELWVGRVEGDRLVDARALVGGRDARRDPGEPDEAVVQPEWAPDGRLYFCSDRSNWWNLYRFERDADGAPVGFPVPLPPVDSDIALPPWIFGRSRYEVTEQGAVFAFGDGGHVHLGVADVERHTVRVVETGLAGFESLRVRGGTVVGVGSGFTTEPAVLEIPLDGGPHRAIRPPRDLQLPAGSLSAPRPVTFPTTDGRTGHAWFYEPASARYRGPDDERPPLVVLSHGGPTSAASPGLSLATQFWTSRGFAVADVDYGGSTGYGRTYRRQLDGAWGIVDVDDCCSAATWLASEGLVDGDRLVIRGGSAGGFTTLAALTFRDVFAAGASSYGVADLEALARDTHKFEARYLDGLVGPWPEAEAVYRERSPIHHTDRLSCPLILLQGSEDLIVPPEQSRAMAEALAAKGIPHAYLEFEGEQHGFRKAETIVRALTAELFFYAHVLGFPLGDDVEPVEIVGA
jgi:dipeptidyl aminopeptidase/acylaminoacyl peptidase